MGSIAEYHYPMVTYRKEEKLLWNPIHRKTLKNRPEERVRLRIIDALLDSGWSRHRISTEEPIRDYTDASLRTDIICYSQDFTPEILVECKAEHVALSGKAAEQAARYNHNIQAPVILITNGLVDYWFRIRSEEREISRITDASGILSPQQETEGTFDYWKERGFAGSKAKPPLRRWLAETLHLFSPDGVPWSSVAYLHFERSPADLQLSHYYMVTKTQRGKIAVTFLATPFGGSRMVAILNREGVNKAVVEIDLDLIFSGEELNGSIYSGAGIQNFNTRKKAVYDWLEKPDRNDFGQLAETLGDLFAEYLGS